MIHYQIVSGDNLRKKPSSTKRQGLRLQYSTAAIKCKAAYDNTTIPEIGDLVRIINPKTGQPNKGTIEGFCADGKAKIRCARNIVIKNIRYHVFE